MVGKAVTTILPSIVTANPLRLRVPKSTQYLHKDIAGAPWSSVGGDSGSWRSKYVCRWTEDIVEKARGNTLRWMNECSFQTFRGCRCENERTKKTTREAFSKQTGTELVAFEKIRQGSVTDSPANRSVLYYNSYTTAPKFPLSGMCTVPSGDLLCTRRLTRRHTRGYGNFLLLCKCTIMTHW